MSNVTDTVSRASVRFDLVEPYEVSALGGAVSGEPLFHFKPDMVQPIDVEYNRRSYILDATIAVCRLRPTMDVTLDASADENDVVRSDNAYRSTFSNPLAGNRVTFTPTFMQDIELTATFRRTHRLADSSARLFTIHVAPATAAPAVGFQFKMITNDISHRRTRGQL
jgi:hypothetical protein